MIANDENRRMRIPKPAWIVGVLLAIALLAGGIYLFRKYNAGYGTRPANGQVSEELQAVTAMEENAWRQEKDRALVWYNDAIAKVERRVDEMERNAIALQSHSLQEFELHLKILEDDLDTLRSEVRQIRGAGKDHWNAIKPKIDETRARIERKLKNDFSDYTVSIE